MKAIKNKAFARGGHECELTNVRDELPMYKSGDNICQQIRNSFLRSIMAGEANVYSLRYLKSQRNIEKERLRHLFHKHMIHPFSDTRQRWEALMVFIFGSAFFVIPIDCACFNFPLVRSISHMGFWKLWRSFLDLIMLIDVMMNFFTGYWDPAKKKVIIDPKTVALRYCFTYFLPDLVSSIPKNIIPLPQDQSKIIVKTINNIGVLKVIRFRTLQRYWKQTCEVYKIGFVKYRLLAALYYYVLYFHVLTCFTMVLIGLQTKNKTPVPGGSSDFPIYVWTDVDDENGFYGAYVKVLRAVIYLGTFCFSTPAIANYVPKLLYTAIWVASKFIMLYLTGELMECVISTRSSTRKYVEMVRELQEYMRYKQLPVHLQNRLLQYYEFKYQKSYFKETEILNVVSGQLKQELLMHSCRKLVEHVGFFQNLPLPLLLRLVSALNTEVYMVNDVIIKAGTIGSCMYFIVSGCVAIYTRTGFEVKHLEDGDYFGEYSLINKSPRECSVIAVESCELYRLEGTDFSKVIMSYPDLVDKITKHASERIEMTQNIERRHQRRKHADLRRK